MKFLALVLGFFFSFALWGTNKSLMSFAEERLNSAAEDSGSNEVRGDG